MKKLTGKVKGFIIAGVSVLCVAAIVLGCVFGIKKPGGGKDTSLFTAAQKQLALEIEKNSEVVDYEVMDKVPYAGICTYSQLTMFSENYFACTTHENYEKFYVYKTAQDNSIETSELTGQAYNFVKLGATSINISKLNENYVVIESKFEENDQTTSVNYSLVYFGGYADGVKPVEVFSYDTAGKNVFIPEGLSLQKEYFVLPQVTNINLQEGSADLKLVYGKLNGATPVEVQELSGLKYYASEELFNCWPHENYYAVHSNDVLKVIYLKNDEFVVLEKEFEVDGTTKKFKTRYSFAELTETKFLLTKTIFVDNANNVNKNSVVNSTDGEGTSYVNYENTVFDFSKNTAVEKTVYALSGYPIVKANTHNDKLSSSYALIYQKTDADKKPIEEYVTAYFDSNDELIVKFASVDGEYITYYGNNTFLTNARILKANKTVNPKVELVFGSQEEGKIALVSNAASINSDYFEISQKVDDFVYSGVMRTDGKIIIDPKDKEFESVFEIFGSKAYAAMSGEGYCLIDLLTKEKTPIDGFVYDSTRNAYATGIYVTSVGSNYSIKKPNGESLIPGQLLKVGDTTNSITTLRGGVYYEVFTENESTPSKLVLYKKVNREYYNEYVSIASAEGVAATQEVMNSEVAPYADGATSKTFTYGSASFTRQKDPYMYIYMSGSYKINTASIGLKFFNTYTLSISSTSTSISSVTAANNYSVGYSYSGDFITPIYAYLYNGDSARQIYYYTKFSYENWFGYSDNGITSISCSSASEVYHNFYFYGASSSTLYNTNFSKVNKLTTQRYNYSTKIQNKTYNFTLPDADCLGGNCVSWRTLQPTDRGTSLYSATSIYGPSSYTDSNTISGLSGYEMAHYLNVGVNQNFSTNYRLKSYFFATYEQRTYNIVYDYDGDGTGNWTAENTNCVTKAWYTDTSYFAKTGYTFTGISLTGCDTAGTHFFMWGELDTIDIRANDNNGDNINDSASTFTTASKSYTYSGNTAMGLSRLRYTAGTSYVTGVFTPNIYTITLDHNSGTSSQTAIYLKYNTGIYKEAACTTSMTTGANAIAVPTRTGYTFNGYYSEETDGTLLISSSGYRRSALTTTYTLEDITIYARWTANTYTVSYTSTKADGTLGTSTYTATYGSIFTVAVPTRKFYIFTGWKITGCTDDCTHYYSDKSNSFMFLLINEKFTGTSIDLVGPEYPYFKNLRSKSGTVTMEAQWVGVEYTASFYGNGGKYSFFGANVETMNYTTKYGTKATSPNHPTLTGYTFTGYDVSGMDTETIHIIYKNNGTTTHTVNYLATTSVTYDWIGGAYLYYQNLRGSAGTATFTAKWRTNLYNIQYDLSNSSGSTGSGTWPYGVAIPTKKNYTHSFSVPRPEAPLGYRFNGWTVSGLIGTISYGTTSSTTSSSTHSSTASQTFALGVDYFRNLTYVDEGTVTFKANWVANTYKIAYDANGDHVTLPSNNPTTATFDSYKQIYDAHRIGYKFHGWIVSGLSDDIPHSYKRYSSSTNYYVIDFESIDGCYTDPDNPNAHYIVGRYSYTSFAILNFHYDPNATITLKAYWSANTYDITYHYADDSCFSTAPDLTKVNKLATMSKTATQSVRYTQYFTTYQGGSTEGITGYVPVPTGYTLAGWFIYSKANSFATANGSVNDLVSGLPGFVVGAGEEVLFNYDFADAHDAEDVDDNDISGYHAYAIYQSVQITLKYYLPESAYSTPLIENYTLSSTTTVGYGDSYTLPTNNNLSILSYMISPNLYDEGELKFSETTFTFDGVTYTTMAGSTIKWGISNMYAINPTNPVFYVYGMSNLQNLKFEYIDGTYVVSALNKNIAGIIKIPAKYDDGAHGEADVSMIADYGFAGCTNITKVYYAGGSVVGAHAFDGCTSLTYAEFSTATAFEDYAFNNCTALVSFYQYGSGNVTYGDYTFYKTSVLDDWRIGSSAKVVEMGKYCFCYSGIDGCVGIIKNLTYVPDYAFYNCSNLETLNMSGLPLQEIGRYAFSWTSITSVSFGSKLTTIGGYAFNYSSLTTLTLPNTVTFVDEYAFSYCRSLTGLTISNSLTKISEGMFKNCTSLPSVTIPANVIEIGYEAFSTCNALTTFTFASGSKLQKIGDGAFYYCKLLSGTIAFPTYLHEIGYRAFYRCGYSATSRTFLTLNDNLAIVGNYAFESARLGGSLILPASLQELGEGAFYCDSTLSYYGGINAVDISKCVGLTEIPTNAFVGSFTYFTNYTSKVRFVLPNSIRKIADYAFGNGVVVVLNPAIEEIGHSTFQNCVVEFDSSFTDADFAKIKYSSEYYGVFERAYLFESDIHRIIRNTNKITNATFFNVTIWDSSATEVSSISLDIHEGVTLIGNNALGFKATISEITLPSSLRVMNSTITSNTVSRLNYHGSQAEWNANVKTTEGGSTTTSLSFVSNSNIYYNVDKMSYTTSGGKATITGASINFTGELRIPSTIGGYPVVAIGSSAFSGKVANVTSVYIADGIETIGSTAFGTGASGIKSVRLPNTLKEIGASVFRYNIDITEIELPDSLEIIGNYAFYGRNLKKVVIPRNVKTIGTNAFQNCLDLIDIKFAGNTLKTIGAYAFDGCSSLKSVALPDSVVTLGAYAFRNCSALINVNLSNNLTIIEDYTFYGCTNLKTVNLPKKLVSIDERAFYDTAITRLNFPSSLEYIGYCAFDECRGLLSADLSNTKITEIAGYAFLNCTSLTDLKFPETLTRLVDGAFYGTSSLQIELELPESLTLIDARVFCYSGITGKLVIPKNVIDIGHWAFGHAKLTEVIFENSEYAGAIDVYGSAFANNTNLKFVLLPEGLTSITSSLFNGDTALKCVYIPSTVTSVESGAFNGCSSLVNLIYNGYDLHGRVSVSSTGNDAYYGATPYEIESSFSVDYIDTEIDGENVSGYYLLGAYNLGDIGSEYFVIPHTYGTTGSRLYVIGADSFSSVPMGSVTNLYILDGVREMQSNAFYDSYQLRNVYLPESLTSFPGSYQFAYCTNLVSINIPKNVEELSDGMFYYASALKSIDIPEKVRIIGYDVFCYTGITSIKLPENLTQISMESFWGSKLTEITIPKSVQSIGDHAFYNSTSLKTVIIEGGNLTSIGSSVFANSGVQEIIYNGTSAEFSAISGSSNIGNIPIYYTQTDTVYETVGSNGEYRITTATLTPNTDYLVLAPKMNVDGIWIPTYVGGNVLPNDYSSVKKLIIMEGIVGLEANAFQAWPALEEVILPSTLKVISNSAFVGCLKLSSIVIPEGIEEIGEYAFHNCQSLLDIKLPTTLRIIKSNAFSSMLFTNIELPNGLQTLEDDVFYRCTNLASIVIPNTVLTIGDSCFQECSNLVSVILSNSLISMGRQVFTTCRKLTYVDMSSSLTAIPDYAFYDTALATVSIPEGVTSIGYHAFRFTSITDINLPSTLKSIGANAFYNVKLNSLVLPNGLETIGDRAFYGCSSITELVIPDTVTSIGEGAFSGCSGITSIKLSKGLTSIPKQAFANCGKLVSVEMFEGVASIGNSAFMYCFKLSSIKLPSTLEIIDNNAFLETSLTNIVIPKSVTMIGNSAFSTTKLTSVIFEGADEFNGTVGVIGRRAFASCTALKHIALPGNFEINKDAFEETVLVTAVINCFDGFHYNKSTEGTVVEYVNIFNAAANATFLSGGTADLVVAEGDYQNTLNALS